MEPRTSERYWGPVYTPQGIEFHDVCQIVYQPNPLPLIANRDISEKSTTHRQDLTELYGKVLTDVETEKKAFFRSKACFTLHFRDRNGLRLEPVNVPYLDLDIKFERLGLTYHPKSRYDLSKMSTMTFEQLAMTGLSHLGLFRNAVIQKCYAGFIQTSANSEPQLDRFVLELKISFRDIGGWAYSHEDLLTCSIYPDRVYAFIENGPETGSGHYGLSLEAL